MGLLDSLNTDQGMLGLMLMQAGQAKPVRTGLGEGLLQALQGVQANRSAQEDRAMKQRMQEAQMGLLGAQLDETKAQATERSAHAAELQRRAAEALRVQGLLQGAFLPVNGAQANAASGVTGPRPEALDVVGQQPRPNYQALIAQGVPAELVQKLAESRNYGRDKVARTVDGRDAQGRPVTFQQDEFGGTVGAPIQQWKAPERIDTGGQINIWDPVSMQTMQALKKTQSPDSLASNGLGYARLNWDKMKDARDGGSGQLIETPNGYVRVGRDNSSIPIMAPGGAAPLMGKGAGMTEDQSKATGWLVQAENAFKNMKAAGFDNSGKPKGSAYPGPADAIEGLPMIGGIANSFRSSDRQRFVQASSSLSEALLRAATGAGVNESEAKQKVRELTPLFGEDETNTAQKMASIPLYIESLKVRAGPGAAKAAAVTAGSKPSGTMPSADAIAAELARRAAGGS